MEYGLQLYSVRGHAQADMASTLRAVAEMGYAYVEFAGYFDNSAADIKDMLAKYDLKVCGAHIGLDALTDEKIEATLNFNKEIGNLNIVIPGMPIGNKRALQRSIDRVNEIQPIIEANGMTLSYHNHSQEFKKKLFCPEPYEELIEKTKLNFEVDVFWVYNAGRVPLEILDRLRDRIRLVHLKDGIAAKGLRGAQSRVLGQGGTGIAEIVEVLKSRDVRMIVESEGNQADAMNDVRRCIDYLNTL